MMFYVPRHLFEGLTTKTSRSSPCTCPMPSHCLLSVACCAVCASAGLEPRCVLPFTPQVSLVERLPIIIVISCCQVASRHVTASTWHRQPRERYHVTAHQISSIEGPRTRTAATETNTSTTVALFIK